MVAHNPGGGRHSEWDDHSGGAGNQDGRQNRRPNGAARPVQGPNRHGGSMDQRRGEEILDLKGTHQVLPVNKPHERCDKLNLAKDRKGVWRGKRMNQRRSNAFDATKWVITKWTRSTRRSATSARRKDTLQQNVLTTIPSLVI
jgi:hypothetical protein